MPSIFSTRDESATTANFGYFYTMCGITGVFAFNLVGKFSKMHVASATQALAHRGPDHQKIYTSEWVCLGHRRLSILDTREVAHQPMWDPTGRYALIFNGEIFNFRHLRSRLAQAGIEWKTESDTEVLLHLLIREGVNALPQLNGFFAFCLYDAQTETLLLARDRFGIKPLLYYQDADRFLFASELKSLLHYGIEKHIDRASLLTYLQLNYIPAPRTIFERVHKLLPGQYLQVRRHELQVATYYQLPHPDRALQPQSYAEAQVQLRQLVDDSVHLRLLADVPVGCFLSGGVDSGIVAASAREKHPQLHTYSIGFPEDPYYDETDYATEVARHLDTQHTVFPVTRADLLRHLGQTLDHLDEPFADSSALAVSLLSQHTRQQVTVALSGDGADEVWGGYQKHLAFHRALHPRLTERLVSALLPVLRLLPQARHGHLANRLRQAVRLGEGMALTTADRYWRWASYARLEQAQSLLIDSTSGLESFQHDQRTWLQALDTDASIGGHLRTDISLVLPNDMLCKVDLMSMAHSLEVRVPFLDFRIVEWAQHLPDDWKVTRHARKRILQDAFQSRLPPRLYHRPKKGFEVPLLPWFRHELRPQTEELLNEAFLRQQGIFRPQAVQALQKQVRSARPGDSASRLYALFVFQWWWRQWMA